MSTRLTPNLLLGQYVRQIPPAVEFTPDPRIPRRVVRSLPPPEALGRIKDRFGEYDGGSTTTAEDRGMSRVTPTPLCEEGQHDELVHKECEHLHLAERGDPVAGVPTCREDRMPWRK
jgi:hypothetical protein